MRAGSEKNVFLASALNFFDGGVVGAGGEAEEPAEVAEAEAGEPFEGAEAEADDSVATAGSLVIAAGLL